MTEWTVVGVIVVLVGLFFTVGKPIIGLVRELQSLRFETDKQQKEIDRDIEGLKELTKIAQAHENRITNQEQEGRNLRTEIGELLKVSQSHEMRIHDLEHDVKDLKQETEELESYHVHKE